MPGYLIGPIGVIPAPVTGGAYQGTEDVVAGTDNFWGLRAVSAAYAAATGPCIDICDNSGANTTTINVTTAGHLDVAAVNTWKTSFGSTVRVSKVYDQVGTSYLYLISPLSTVSQMPILSLTEGGSGTQPGLVFTLAAHSGLGMSPHLLSGLDIFSISAVAKHGSPSDIGFTHDMIFGTGNYSPTIGWSAKTAGTFVAGLTGYGSTPISGAAADGALHSLILVCNDTVQDGYVNGSALTQQALVPANIGDDAGLFLGHNAGFNESSDMVIHEVRLDLTPLTSGNVTSIYNNHKAYWGTL